MTPEKKPHWDLSREIIGSAMAVLNELGPGLDESSMKMR